MRRRDGGETTPQVLTNNVALLRRRGAAPASPRVVPCMPILWPFLCRRPRTLCICFPPVPSEWHMPCQLDTSLLGVVPTSRTSVGRLGSHFTAAPPTQPARQRRRCRLPERTTRASGSPRVPLHPPPTRARQIPVRRRREVLRSRRDLRRVRARCGRQRIPRR